LKTGVLIFAAILWSFVGIILDLSFGYFIIVTIGFIVVGMLTGIMISVITESANPKLQSLKAQNHS
jgi:hypothetical protein